MDNVRKPNISVCIVFLYMLSTSDDGFLKPKYIKSFLCNQTELVALDVEVVHLTALYYIFPVYPVCRKKKTIQSVQDK
jgi:hypothetical protein